ncbi:MAG: DUF6584 family protein [Pseudomonadota bacterium]
MRDYRTRVDEALSSGRVWRAKEILQGRLAIPCYDPELYLRYAKLLKEMGDDRIAGRYFFLSGERSPDYKDCIKLFLDRDGKGSFSEFWSAMPAGARTARQQDVPQIVLDELAALGFTQREIKHEFQYAERWARVKQSLEKSRAAGDGPPWPRRFDILIVLLFVLYFASAMFLGTKALVELLASWSGF